MAYTTLTLTLNEKQMESIKNMQELTGGTPAGVVHQALRLLAVAAKEHRKGNSLVLVNEQEQIVGEITGVFGPW